LEVGADIAENAIFAIYENSTCHHLDIDTTYYDHEPKREKA
jgi:hypothetical protein